jgi:hypothetical protein
MKYRVEYSNGFVQYMTFHTEEDRKWFLHNEGDHVVSCVRWNKNKREKELLTNE